VLPGEITVRGDTEVSGQRRSHQRHRPSSTANNALSKRLDDVLKELQIYAAFLCIEVLHSTHRLERNHTEKSQLGSIRMVIYRSCEVTYCYKPFFGFFVQLQKLFFFGYYFFAAGRVPRCAKLLVDNAA